MKLPIRTMPTAVAAGLVALTLYVYLPVRDHDFIRYDDHLYVIDNPMLDEPLSTNSLAEAFYPYETNWIPASWISLQLDTALWGREPAGYLLTNVALHALGAITLFSCLLIMTGALWRSAAVAAVFAIHPLHVESVAWVSERKDVLSGLLFGLVLLLYARAAKTPDRPFARSAILVTFVLGLLTKPMLVTTPLVLLLLDFWPLGRLQRLGVWRVVLEKWPLYLLSVVFCIVTFAVQRDLGAMPENAPSLLERGQNALHSIVFYLQKSIWPTGLSVFYPYPPVIGTPLQHALRVLLIAAISAVAISRVRREPALLFGWAWFLVMLIPVLGLVQVGMQARADRYTYLPQIGLAIAGVWGVGGAVLRRHSRWLSALAAAAAVSALLALAVTARQQVHHWRNTQALFEHALAHTQGNYIALQILGDEAARADHLDEAERLYRESLSLKDDWAPTHADLGRLQVRQGRVEDAIRSFAISARLDRQSVDARTALASTLISVERFAGADAALADAAALDPLDAEIPANRSVVAFATGDRASALQHGREALRLGPQSPIAANLVAWILSTHPDPKKRDPEEALRVARLGLALAGDEEHLLLGSLAASLAAAGRFEEATATAERLVAYFEANDEPALAQQARSHAQLYRSGQALVEPDVKSR